MYDDDPMKCFEKIQKEIEKLFGNKIICKDVCSIHSDLVILKQKNHIVIHVKN
jgi:hypothetical protein